MAQETATSAVAEQDDWVPVAVETYRYQMLPWVGRRFERWLGAQVRRVPHDPGIVLVPKRVYEVFRSRPLMTPINEEQARAIGAS